MIEPKYVKQISDLINMNRTQIKINRVPNYKLEEKGRLEDIKKKARVGFEIHETVKEAENTKEEIKENEKLWQITETNQMELTKMILENKEKLDEIDNKIDNELQKYDEIMKKIYEENESKMKNLSKKINEKIRLSEKINDDSIFYGFLQ